MLTEVTHHTDTHTNTTKQGKGAQRLSFVFCMFSSQMRTSDTQGKICSVLTRKIISTASRPGSSRPSPCRCQQWSPWGCRCCDSPAGLLQHRDGRNEWPRPLECYPTCTGIKRQV